MGAPKGEWGSSGYTFNNGYSINISYRDLYEHQIHNGNDKISFITGHRGWKIDNVNEWMPALKAAVQDSKTQEIYDRIATPEEVEQAKSSG